MKIWLVFHQHIEHDDFVSAHLTEKGADEVVIEHEDIWGDGHGGSVGGKFVIEVEAT